MLDLSLPKLFHGGPLDGQKRYLSSDTDVFTHQGATYVRGMDGEFRFQTPVPTDEGTRMKRPGKPVRTMRDKYDALPSAEKDRIWAVLNEMLLRRGGGIFRQRDSYAAQVAEVFSQNGVELEEYC